MAETAGVAGATALGISMIALIGHLEYYPRFGSKPASELGLTCNIPVPNNVFMALAFDEERIYPGRLVFPPAFFG